jgi:hypothetical protein
MGTGLLGGSGTGGLERIMGEVSPSGPEGGFSPGASSANVGFGLPIGPEGGLDTPAGLGGILGTFWESIGKVGPSESTSSWAAAAALGLSRPVLRISSAEDFKAPAGRGALPLGMAGLGGVENDLGAGGLPPGAGGLGTICSVGLSALTSGSSSMRAVGASEASIICGDNFGLGAGGLGTSILGGGILGAP